MHEESSTPQHRVPRVTLNCRRCGRPFEVLASQSLVTGRPYCGPDCAGKAKATPMEARFWAGVEKIPDGCWDWKKACSHGRPILPLPGHGAGYVRADIYSWELHFGPLPAGGKMHQTCGNRRCVNPDHMAAGPKPRKERAKRPPSPNARPPKVECVCALPACGKTFSVWPSRFKNGREVKYCSRECQGRAARRSLEERFWAKVEVNGPLPPDHPELGPCSIWQGARIGKYGAFEGTTAHRFALALYGRPAPEDGDACHHCDVPLCVRDSHLFPGTRADNIHDMIAKNRQAPPEAASHPGEQNPNAKLTEAGVVSLREQYAAGGVTQAVLASQFGISRGLVSLIVTQRAWKHVK